MGGSMDVHLVLALRRKDPCSNTEGDNDHQADDDAPPI